MHNRHFLLQLVKLSEPLPVGSPFPILFLAILALKARNSSLFFPLFDIFPNHVFQDCVLTNAPVAFWAMALLGHEFQLSFSLV